MKYRIIWIDDSETWVNSVHDELIDAFESKRFTPEVYKFTGICDIVRNEIESNYLDLLIIDCNLQGMNGNEFILELRQNKCFSHIIFYSQEEKNLQLIRADDHFSHVTPRSGFSDIIEVIADQAFRKYNHPAFMRGLLLSEFIDLEGLMDDLIAQCFKGESDYFKQSILNKGGESFGLGSKQKFISRLINSSKEMDPSLETNLNDINFSSSQFQSKIIQKRNILAHASPQYDSESDLITLISAFPDTQFDSHWFYETRSSIHEFKNKIKRLISMELFKVVNP